MTPRSAQVVFLGGPARYASVKIRCLQIAHALGCVAVPEVESLEQVPPKTRLVICVKPRLRADELEHLAGRARVLWDVHDELPPPLPEAAHLLCSTKHARAYLRQRSEQGVAKRNIHVIPHHHSNLDGTANPWRTARTVRWIGRPRWKPEQLPACVEVVDSKPLGPHKLRAAYRGTDVAYNFRSSQRPDTTQHLALNPGLKALNAMGFSLPSVSPMEPAYLELASEGTILCHGEAEAKWHVRRLLDDDEYCRLWRERAFKHGQRFHIAVIAERYRQLLLRLEEP